MDEINSIKWGVNARLCIFDYDTECIKRTEKLNTDIVMSNIP